MVAPADPRPWPDAQSHMTSFRPGNPVTGEWIDYTAIAADSEGQFVCFNWRSVPRRRGHRAHPSAPGGA